MATPTLDQLRKAIQISEKIEALQAELAGILGSAPDAVKKTGAKRGPKPGKHRRTMSAEARARIAEAQKKRWAKQKS